MTELISAIIPVYNTVDYLSECLESVCAQTYTNLEIILIDDGSSDGSGRLCDEWAEKDGRIKAIHQENAGVSAARNAGLAACTGDLITFVDSDDWLDLEMLSKLHQCLTENEAEAAMCGFVDYPHGSPVEKGVIPVQPCDFKDTVFQMMRGNGYHTTPWAKIFKRNLLFRDNCFPQFDCSLAFGEDEVWLLEVLQHSARVAFLPHALYYWRPREGSASRPEVLTSKQLSIFAAKRKTFYLLPDDEAIRSLARGRIFNDCYSLKVLAYINGNYKYMQIVERELKPMWWDWIRSNDVRLVRKIKVLILEAEMFLHLPKSIVKKTNELH